MKSILKSKLFLFFLMLALGVTSCRTGEKTDTSSISENKDTYYRDIYPDTWVANDALGRKMPSFSDVGPVKDDQRRVVGIFYITWHTQDYLSLKQPYSADVTQILQQDPNARFEANNPLWTESFYHWGEPENGYFLSQDEYVIRKDMSMLSDAGVDVLVMDVTNAVRYWDEWELTFSTMEKMKAEGNKVPQFVFWAFNGPVITVVQDLYDRIYKEEKFTDLWFYWDGKPLLLYNGEPTVDANGGGVKNPNPHYDAAAKNDKDNPHFGNPDYAEEFYQDYTKEVKEFFTLRTMWWGYYKWAGKRFVGSEDNWSFGYSMANEEVKSMTPEELISKHKGTKEEFAVTPAQHPVTMTSENMGVGKSWSKKDGEPKLNQFDLPDSAYVSWLGETVKDPVGYGIYFQERWEEALEADPQFLYINDWNEWTAGKYQPEDGGKMAWLGRYNSFFFVDQYNSEFNRTVSPMKGGYTDNYYMQMAQNIRRYKGVRSIPEQSGFTSIKIDGNFSDWSKIKNEFRDTQNDIFHRDALGYASIHYVNNSGRNDIITSKVAVDEKMVSFYAETSNALSKPTDNNNWMLLLIDADKNPETGWYGYDFIINKHMKSAKTTILMRYDEGSWEEVAELEFKTLKKQLELAVPRNLLGLTDDQFTFDFKWTDNPEELKDPISLCTHGDTAPNRRFNYRLIWKK